MHSTNFSKRRPEHPSVTPPAVILANAGTQFVFLRVASFQTLQATHGLDSRLRGNDDVERICDNHAMLLDFFYHLRHRGLKPSTREFLTLLEALKADVISPSIDDFYFLSKATLVKDESKFDRYDFAFAEYFKRRRRTG